MIDRRIIISLLTRCFLRRTPYKREEINFSSETSHFHYPHIDYRLNKYEIIVSEDKFHVCFILEAGLIDIYVYILNEIV